MPAATHPTRCWSTKCLVFATPDTRRTTFTIIAAAIYKSEMFLQTRAEASCLVAEAAEGSCIAEEACSHSSTTHQGLSSCSERKP